MAAERDFDEVIKDIIEAREDEDKFIEALRQGLDIFSNDKYRNSVLKAFPELDTSFGTPIPILKKFAKELGEVLKEEPEFVAPFVKILWRSGSREERLIAAEILGMIERIESEEVLNVVSGFLEDISNWEVCDVLAIYGLGPFVFARYDDFFSSLKIWAESENRWTRRFAIASIIPLVHEGERLNVETIFEVLNVVMKEKERDVQEVISRVLLDMSRKESYKVGSFLKDWAEKGDGNTEWIVKRGMQKLPDKEKLDIMANYS